MLWGFWNRSNKKKRGSDADAASSQSASQSVAYSDSAGGVGFSPLTSPKEILGLQQLIGNQEVLRMLDPGGVKASSSGSVRSERQKSS
jgi:hypothetical protein